MPMPDYCPSHPIAEEHESGSRADDEIRSAIQALEAKIHELDGLRATAACEEAVQLSVAIGRLEELLTISRKTQARLEAERQAKG